MSSGEAREQLQASSPARWRFNLTYLFLETLLVAICAGAIRFNLLTVPQVSYFHLASFDVAVISGCAALGGLVLRLGIGAIVGAVIATVLAPFWFLIHASAAC
jgi:hypothetical protein